MSMLLSVPSPAQRRFYVVVAVTLVALTAACSSGTEEGSSSLPTTSTSAAGAPSAPSTFPPPPHVDGYRNDVTAAYLGLTLDEAKTRAAAEDHMIRVVQADGRLYGVTDDIDENRINVSLGDGVVMDAFIT
jgi:hypothetical protein